MCTKTCSDLYTPNPLCEEECVAGCTCPRGQVIDENTGDCVSRKTCGCQYENGTIGHGEVVKIGCKTW